MPSGGTPPLGVISNGAVHSVLYPSGWHGNINFNKASYGISNDDTLIESSYIIQSIVSTFAALAINVSNVQGYSYPAVCRCVQGNVYLSGCDKKLWSMGTCPNINAQHDCVNPNRSDDDKVAIPFFAPCTGLSYTFPNDHDAVSNGECQSGHVICEFLPDEH